jgi:outer membrane protein insertion porin family
VRKNSLIFATLIAILVPVLLYANPGEEKVKGVVVEGVINVKQSAVLKKLKTRTGRPYNDEYIKSDLQKIMEMGYFEKVDVSVDTATYKVYFKVKEKPLVKKIVFKGNKKISSGTLKQDIPLKENDYFDLVELEQSKDKILTDYSEKGYPDCKADTHTVVDEKTNQMTVTILITEGNQMLVGKIELQGVKAFKQKKVLAQMDNIKVKKVFKLENLNKDIDLIKDFYKNNGYIQVELSEPKIEYNNDRTLMYITIIIKEGVKYKVGEINFSGYSVFSENTLKNAVVLKKGSLFKEDDWKETQQALMDLYSDKGYLNARIVPKFKPDDANGIMNIDIDITENNIVYIGKIYIDGLVATRENVIRREVLLKEGDVFAASKVRRTMEIIHNLGFIDNVEPEILPTQKQDVMDLDFNVTEGKPGMLSAGAGYSSVDLLVGTLQLTHLNLFGKAQKLNLQWEFGARVNNYQLSWTEPWFLDKRMGLNVSLFDTQRLMDYGDITGAYTQDTKGGSITLSPRLSDKMSLSFGYTYEEINITLSTDTAVALPTTLLPVNNDINSIISTQVTWDSRDNIYDPSHGSIHSFGVSLAGGPLGGNVNYYKPVIKNTFFFPTFWKFVLTFNTTFGLIQSFGESTDVPYYDRFYVGGADTVRGYVYRTQIGPVDGGTAMAVGNVEFKFPLVEEKKHSVLVGAFFFDIGGTWDSLNDVNFTVGPDDNDLKCGAGFGIRFTSPVFPLRLDWGYGFDHKPGEDVSQIYFNIGNVF